MDVTHREIASCDPTCEIRIGIASWDRGEGNFISIKFASKDKNGRVTRSGEIPIEALPQMLTMAIRHNFINLE